MGAYHFARPDKNRNSAVSEANHFLSVAGSYILTGNLPPVLDLENPDVSINLELLFTRAELTAWVQTWLATVQNATGKAPIIYTTGSLANYLNSSLNGYKLWIANPTTSPTAPPTNIGNWTTWAFKQYSQTGTVSGIDGNVDLDVFNGTQTDFNNLIGIGGQPDLTITNQTTSTSTVATGSNITVSCIEKNLGNAVASANIAKIYLSSDAVLTPGSNGDTYIDFMNFSSVAASSSSPINSKSITIPNGTTAGNYYLFFWADGGQVVTESNENNNFATIQLSVTASTQTYSISTSSNPIAGGITSGGRSYSVGQQATLVATSNSGYTFVNWTENGNSITTNSSYSFNVTGNRNLVANFTNCAFTLDHYSTSVPATSFTGDLFWIFSETNCNWSATTNGCSWITINNPTGRGMTLSNVTISANTLSTSRTCTISVGGKNFVITQVGYVAPCANSPSTPTGLTAYIANSNQITLSWTGTFTNVSDCKIERSLSSTGPFVEVGSSTNYGNYQDNNVVGGTTYYYRVKACCSATCSNYTNVATQQACTFSSPATGIVASRNNICAGDSVTLTVQGGYLGTQANWNWRLTQCNSGPFLGLGSSITVAPSATSIYVVRPQGGECMTGMLCAVITINVNQQPVAPTISAGGATTFCQGGNVTLLGNNSGGTWSNGSTASSITVATSGDYFITQSNSCGSSTSNHILVNVNPNPNISTFASSSSVCLGDSVIISGGGASSYSWTNGITNGVAFKPTVTTTYTVTGTDINGCKNTATKTIIVTNPCSVGISNNEENVSIFVYPNPVNDFLNISGSNLPNDNYTVSITNILGQKLLENNIVITDTKIEKQIDMKSLSNGVFFLTINSAKIKKVFKVNK